MFCFLKDIIAPKKCYFCKKEGHFLCLNCLSRMSNFNSVCYVCKKKSSNFVIHKSCQQGIYYNQMIIVTHYSNRYIARLVKDAKYFGKRDILYDMGYFLGLKFIQNYSISKDDIIIGVPMNFWKKLGRGYNQSEIMAKYIAKKHNILYINNVLKKKKHTRQQSCLSRQKRQENILNSFEINKNIVDIIDKKNIIIVDDVVSTGSTINEAAKILKKYGVKSVIGLCFSSD